MADRNKTRMADVERLVGPGTRVLHYAAGRAPANRQLAMVCVGVSIVSALVVGIFPGGLGIAVLSYFIAPYRALALTDHDAVIVRCGITSARPNAVLARAPREELILGGRHAWLGGVPLTLSRRGAGPVAPSAAPAWKRV